MSGHSKRISKLRIIGPLWGNPLIASGFPSQRVSNAEKVLISWHHHENIYFVIIGLYHDGMETNVVPITCRLWGEATGNLWIPLTKANTAELSYFLCWLSVQVLELTIKLSVLWDSMGKLLDVCCEYLPVGGIWTCFTGISCTNSLFAGISMHCQQI